MPLIKGKSKKSIAENIAQLLRDYEKTGKIGNIKPKNKAHAKRIAAAIAFRLARSKK